MTHLYPYNVHQLTKQDYIDFSGKMKPYLKPRVNGVNKTSLFTEGFGKYLRDVGEDSLMMEELSGTESLEKEDVAYYHTNSADQVDVILLEDVTGSCYVYGKIKRYSGQDGINLSGGTRDAYNPAATLTNSAGSSEKYLCAISSSSDRYVGIALTPTNSGYERVTQIRRLRELEDLSSGDFFLQDGTWYVEAEGNEYRVSDQVEIHLSEADLWLSGTDGLTSALADGYTLTLYYDRSPDEGGQVRIIVAE